MGRRIRGRRSLCAAVQPRKPEKVSERNSHKPRYWGTSIVLGKAQIVDTGLSPKVYHLRFLWRLAREAFFRLCLLILALRRFFNDPILFGLFLRESLVDHFIERVFNNSCPGCFQFRDNFAHHMLINHRVNGDPAILGKLVDGGLRRREDFSGVSQGWPAGYSA